jgi:hypothetical protein
MNCAFASSIVAVLPCIAIPGRLPGTVKTTAQPVVIVVREPAATTTERGAFDHRIERGSAEQGAFRETQTGDT